ncbi:MAG: efflux transporter outer membrane subunit [Xanthobacteraceae bacterium]
MINHATRLIPFMLSVALAGCAVGPDFETPPAPEQQTYLPRRLGGDVVPGHVVVRGAEVPPQWWELLRSPALNGLVEEGIAHNADLEAAEAALRAAEANARAQRGALFPVFGAGYTPTRQRVPLEQSSPLESGANIFNLHTMQVTVTYVADVWGGARRQIESADALAELEKFRRQAVYLTLVSSIALAAIEEGRLNDQIAATRRIINLQTELLAILRKQSDHGQIAMPDVLSQETALAQARLLLPALEKKLAQQRNLIAFLTGRFPAQAQAARFRLASFTLPRNIPLSLSADLVRQRPDVLAAEANLRAANAQIGVAIANRLPQIALTANAGTAATRVSQLFSPAGTAWMVGASVAQTVFDAGTLENKQRAAEALTQQALAQYRGAVLAAFQNVADVLQALQSDVREIQAATTAQQAASRSVTLARRQIEQGQVNTPILISAQQAYLQASLALIDAQASRLTNVVALYQALGGGWWSRPVPAAPAAAED